MSAPASAGSCTVCGDELWDHARFCEACGAPTDRSGDAAAVTCTSQAPAPGGEARACAGCGEAVDPDGYCTACGLRQLDPIVVEQAGVAAYATHRGARRRRNEDAAALGTTIEGWPVLAVADGVSISPNPHRAAAAAAESAVRRLIGQRFTGEGDLIAAVEAAHKAATAIPADDPLQPGEGDYPATTLAVAVVADGVVHAASVGDSRVHVLSLSTEPGGPQWRAQQLSVDDSIGHAVTAWLGADAPSPDPHLATAEAAPGDLVIVSSDGLWSYAGDDQAFGEMVGSVAPQLSRAAGSDPEGNASGDATDLAAAGEQLVAWALDQGGHDNICVALATVEAAASPAPPDPPAPAPAASGGGRPRRPGAGRPKAGLRGRPKAGLPGRPKRPQQSGEQGRNPEAEAEE